MQEENKILSFVKDFNEKVESFELHLVYTSNGFTQGVQVPEDYVFDDENNLTDHVYQTTLSRLFLNSGEINKVASDMLKEEVHKYFKPIIEKMKVEFPGAKVRATFTTNRGVEVFVKGEYDESIMEDFLEVVEEDFKYLFEGIKIEINN